MLKSMTFLLGFALFVPLLADINVTKTVVGYGYEFNTTLVGKTVDATGVCVAADASAAYT